MTIRIPRLAIFLGALALIFLASTASSCDGTSEAERNDRQVTDNQLDIYNKAQPVHTYNYSMPRDVMQQIYDATMSAHNTWTVFYSYGQPIDMCPSVGFPIPGGTQLTSPGKTITTGSDGIATVPQAEPNGLYSPDSANAGTWVLCVYNGKIEPRYAEPDVITFAHPVEIRDGKIVHIGGASTITVTVRDQPAAPPPATPGR